MSLLSILILGAAINMNNFSTGVLLGKRKVVVSFEDHWILVLICVFFTLLADLVGSYFYRNLPNVISTVLGATLIFLLGLHFLLYKNEQNSTLNNINNKKMCRQKVLYNLPLKDTIQLGMGSLLHCLILGTAAGLVGTYYIGLLVSVVVFGLLSIIFGRFVGKRYASLKINHSIERIIGVLLMLMSICIVL